MARHEFTYPSTIQSEEAMLDNLEASLRAENVLPDESMGFRLSVNEAFNNAVLHGNGADPARQVRFCLTINEDSLSADISDQGSNGLARIRARRDRGQLAEGGRGIDLIRHYADTVEYAETESGGLRVIITVLRKKEHVRR